MLNLNKPTKAKPILKNCSRVCVIAHNCQGTTERSGNCSSDVQVTHYNSTDVCYAQINDTLLFTYFKTQHWLFYNS